MIMVVKLSSTTYTVFAKVFFTTNFICFDFQLCCNRIVRTFVSHTFLGKKFQYFFNAAIMKVVIFILTQ